MDKQASMQGAAVNQAINHNQKTFPLVLSIHRPARGPNKAKVPETTGIA